jgi:hypothetical protein
MTIDMLDHHKAARQRGGVLCLSNDTDSGGTARQLPPVRSMKDE